MDKTTKTKQNFITGELGHIFNVGEPESKVRICFNIQKNKIEEMQIQVGAEWQKASRFQLGDVQDSLLNSNEEAIEFPEDFGLQHADTIPSWALSCSPSSVYTL